MAVPFFEPRPSENAPQADQVDGHGGPPAPSMPLTIPPSTATETSELTFNEIPPTVADDSQVLAWKILAVAMCKALKEYYVQSSSAANAFTSGNGSLVQVLPNGQVQPVWK